MKKLLIWALLVVGGCGPVIATDYRPFAPGSRLILTFRTEMRHRGAAVAETSIESVSSDGKEAKREVVEREESPFTEIPWADVALFVKCTQTDGADHFRVNMTVRGMANGYSSGPPEGPLVESEDSGLFPKEWKGLSFEAEIDRHGELTGWDAKGGQFDEMKREWQQEEQISAEQKAMALHLHSFGVFPALSDAAAYLPPPDLKTGQTWRVSRKKVFPYQAYAFYMMTNGCGYSTERSTCNVISIEQTEAGRMATIEITGNRYPGPPEPTMPMRVDRLRLAGTMRFNLDSGNDLHLRLESTVQWLKAEDKSGSLSFVETVSLHPSTAGQEREIPQTAP